jgi:hypothetical protein
MKKYLIGLFAIIVIATCAFTLKPSSQVVKKETSGKQVSLYWFIPGTPAVYTGRQDTKANEISPSGCPNTGQVHCEDGYDDNDLVTSGDPYSGLKTGATINEFIPKP